MRGVLDKTREESLWSKSKPSREDAKSWRHPSWRQVLTKIHQRIHPETYSNTITITTHHATAHSYYRHFPNVPSSYIRSPSSSSTHYALAQIGHILTSWTYSPCWMPCFHRAPFLTLHSAALFSQLTSTMTLDTRFMPLCASGCVRSNSATNALIVITNPVQLSNHLPCLQPRLSRCYEGFFSMVSFSFDSLRPSSTSIQVETGLVFFWNMTNTCGPVCMQWSNVVARIDVQFGCEDQRSALL